MTRLATSTETEVADFVCQFSDGLYSYGDHAQIEKFVMLHMMYGTLMIVRDNGEIIAVCRWNMPTPTHARILDLIVHPNFRHKFLARKMFIRAKRAMPQLETFEFHRKKYNFRTSHHLISNWTKEKSHGRKS